MFRDRFFDSYHHNSPFNKGDIKYVVLDLLKDKPRYGYEIIQEMKERSHGFYKPSPGVIYPTLQMLEEVGYASSKEIDKKRYYEITRKGLDFLRDRENFAGSIREHMDHHWNFKNAKKMRKMLKELRSLRKIIGPGMRDIDDYRIDQITERIIKARNDVEAIINK